MWKLHANKQRMFNFFLFCFPLLSIFLVITEMYDDQKIKKNRMALNNVNQHITQWRCLLYTKHLQISVALPGSFPTRSLSLLLLYPHVAVGIKSLGMEKPRTIEQSHVGERKQERPAGGWSMVDQLYGTKCARISNCNKV